MKQGHRTAGFVLGALVSLWGLNKLLRHFGISSSKSRDETAPKPGEARLVSPAPPRPTDPDELIAWMKERFSYFVSPESEKAGLAYQPVKEDIFICTYPKCGTTWTQQIVHQMVSGGDMDFDEINDVSPWLEHMVDMGQDVEKWPRRRIFKTHCTYEDVPKSTEAKYIVVIRNGLDVVTSFYNFLNGWMFFDDDGSCFDAFFRNFFMTGSRSGNYFAHVLAYWQQRHQPNLLLLRFEDLKSDPVREIKKISSFLEIDLSKSELDRVVKMSSFQYMKEHESHFDDHAIRRHSSIRMGVGEGSTSKIKTGKVGAARKLLTEEHLAAYNEAWANTFGAIGIHSYEELPID